MKQTKEVDIDIKKTPEGYLITTDWGLSRTAKDRPEVIREISESIANVLAHSDGDVTVKLKVEYEQG